MKPQDLYKLPPIKVIGDDRGEYECFDGLGEIIELESVFEYKIKDLEKKFYIDYCFDGRRGAELASWWYKGKPFMIITTSGRENENTDSWITDHKTFFEVKEYIRSLAEPEEEEWKDCPLVENIPSLDKIYGHPFDYYYDKDLKLKYKEGDIVKATVKLYPHEHWNDEYKNKTVDVKAKIVSVYPMQPNHPYHLIMLDHGIKIDSKPPHKLKKGLKGMGSKATDDTIIGLWEDV